MKPPPEEKLLKLIRGKSGRPEGPPAAISPVSASGGSAASALTLTGSTRWSWTAVAGWVLGALLGLEAVGLLVQLLRPLPMVPALNEPSPASQKPMAASEPSSEELPSLAAIVAQPIFSAGTAAAQTVTLGAAGPRSAPSATAKQLADRLTLTGIIAGDQPQAIIEDAQTKKTFMVTPGQPVIDGAVLERVLDTRVVLDLNGEKIELTL